MRSDRGRGQIHDAAPLGSSLHEQIAEIAFKRLKSLVELDAQLAKGAALAHTAKCAKLIVALLTGDLLAEVLASSPLRRKSRRSH